MAEIKATARRHLVASGPEALSLRAVARDMGVTAPALYRYVDSRDDLLTEVITELYDELTSSLEAARDELPADAIGPRLVAASWALRSWALAHPTEFGLLFGSPLPGYAVPSEGPLHEAGRRFGMVYAALFAQLWEQRPFPCARTEDLDPALAASSRRTPSRWAARCHPARSRSSSSAGSASTAWCAWRCSGT